MATFQTFARGTPSPPGTATATSSPLALRAMPLVPAKFSISPRGAPLATSQSATPPAPGVISVFPSGLKTTPTGPVAARDDGIVKQRSRREIPDRRGPVAGDGCKRSSVRREGERLDLAAGLQERWPGGSQIACVQERDALRLEADGDQPAVRAEPARVAVVGRSDSRSCVNVNGRLRPRLPVRSHAITFPSTLAV